MYIFTFLVGIPRIFTILRLLPASLTHTRPVLLHLINLHYLHNNLSFRAHVNARAEANHLHSRLRRRPDLSGISARRLLIKRSRAIGLTRSFRPPPTHVCAFIYIHLREFDTCISNTAVALAATKKKVT